MALRIVLMGTGEFAVPVFRALMRSEHTVVGVFTQPDKTGRGHHQHPHPVRDLAVEHAIPLFQPPRVNRPEVLDQLRALQADVFVVASYGQILKPELLAIPRLGAFNLHGSLLPRHRGAAPVQYAIRVGDRMTGVTMFQIVPALDAGPMVGRVTTEIGPGETSGDLLLRLADLSVPLTLDVLRQLEAGTAVFETQDPALVTLAPRIDKSEGEVDWQQSAAAIDCHVRAMQPWPRASTWLHRPGHPAVRCLLLQVNPVPETGTHSAEAGGSGRPGQIVASHGRLWVRTGDGLLEIQRIQVEGRKPVDALAFLNGQAVSVGDRFAAAEAR